MGKVATTNSGHTKRPITKIGAVAKEKSVQTKPITGTSSSLVEEFTAENTVITARSIVATATSTINCTGFKIVVVITVIARQGMGYSRVARIAGTGSQLPGA